MTLRHYNWIIVSYMLFIFLSCENEGKPDVSESFLIESADFNEESILPENVIYDSLDLIIDTSKIEVIRLQIPNHSAYSYDERLKMKLDIYNLLPTYEYRTWNNPTSGGSVHINSNDELIVYQSLQALPTDSSYGFHYQDDFQCPDSISLKRYVHGYTYGNLPSVLITSEINPKESKAMDKILEDLFRSHQLYYLMPRQK